MRASLLSAIALVFITGVSGAGQSAAQTVPATISLTSTAFKDGQPIPKIHAAVQGGKNLSPALSWSNAPASTREFALVMTAIDLQPGVPNPPLVQWLVYRIPGTTTGLPQGLGPGTIASGALQGTTQGMDDIANGALISRSRQPAPPLIAEQTSTRDTTQMGQREPEQPARRPIAPMNYRPEPAGQYRGPFMLPGKGVRHYEFRVYALDATLDLKEGLMAPQLLAAIHDHVVGEGVLVGTYQP